MKPQLFAVVHPVRLPARGERGLPICLILHVGLQWVSAADRRVPWAAACNLHSMPRISARVSAPTCCHSDCLTLTDATLDADDTICLMVRNRMTSGPSYAPRHDATELTA